MAPRTKAAGCLEELPAQKKAKVASSIVQSPLITEPDLVRISGVLSDIERYTMTLPTSARKMLADSAPMALCEKGPEPHEFTGEVIGMIGSALEDAKVACKADVEASEEEVQTAKQDMEACDVSVIAMADAMASASSAVVVKQQVVDAAQSAVKQADEERVIAVIAHQSSEEVRQRLEQDKDAASEVLASFQLLLNALPRDGEVQQVHISAIQRRLKTIGAEGSLIAAIPRAVGKDTRTEFDNVVFDSMRVVLEKDVADCGEKLEAAMRQEVESSAEALGAAAAVDELISCVTRESHGLVELRVKAHEATQTHAIAKAALEEQSSLVGELLCKQASMKAKCEDADGASMAFERLAARRRESLQAKLANLGC